MTLTVTCKRLPQRRGSSNQHQQRAYTDSYKIIQTDTGGLVSEPEMIIAAQAVVTGDPLPIYGDNWSYGTFTDSDSYAQAFDWERPNPADEPHLLHVNVQFSPAESTNPGKFAESDPLLWPTEYWVEWTEEQVVLEEATNVEEMPTIERDALTLGKVVNACGVEFTEPLMRTVYYPVLHCQKYYESLDEIVLLNTTYQNTTNNGSFFGADARMAKYLGTESGRIQKAGNQSFYVGITRVWFKKSTWDRPVLNNGWGHFKRGSEADILVDSSGKPILFKNKVHDLASTVEDDPDADPDIAASEPLNLDLDGELLSPAFEPSYVTYRDLEEVDYSGIGIGG